MPKQRLTKIHGIGVLPTDTLYGIVGSALSKKIVERIYILRKRNRNKPMIVLISSLADLEQFGVCPSPKVKKILKKLWPGKVSIILPITRKGSFLRKFNYLHRGTGKIAFRLPNHRGAKIIKSSGRYFNILRILKKTGPLVAPSANFEGETPAKTIHAAKKYFGDKIDFYIDVGLLKSKPSTLIAIEDRKMIVVRKGAVRIN